MARIFKVHFKSHRLLFKMESPLWTKERLWKNTVHITDAQSLLHAFVLQLPRMHHLDIAKSLQWQGQDFHHRFLAAAQSPSSQASFTSAIFI